MCGICGLVNLATGEPVERALLEEMCDTLTHRGPDDEGLYLQRDAGLAMRRLSIIDLQTGHQPIHNEDGTIWVVCNGEVYNYQALRRELEARGHRFYTHSDTETLVHLYEEYGERSVERLNGMFAFAIWDENSETLFLARDRLGIKPLYHAIVNDKLVFASELKAILCCSDVSRELDQRALNHYLGLRYVPCPLTIFKQVKKLPPGHTLTCTREGVRLRQYWDVEFAMEFDSHPDVYYLERFRELFEDAVCMRLMSDVPLGAFLSGGIDSSSVVGVMSRAMDRPVQTFSIGFQQGGFDETAHAREIAHLFSTEHNEFTVAASVMDFMSKLVWYCDEPFADPAALPTFVLSHMAREYVTVVLTGDGGDEVFAGYQRYRSEEMADYLAKVPALLRRGLLVPLLKLLGLPVPASNRLSIYVESALKHLRLADLAPDARYLRRSWVFDHEDRQLLYAPAWRDMLTLEGEDVYRPYFERARGYPLLNQRLYVDIKTYLPDQMLTKVDRMTMSASLEARVPFLDHRLVEFAATVPPQVKMSWRVLKKLVRTAMADMLPPSIVKRPKHGFEVPIDHWFRSELKDYAADILLSDQPFFNRDYVRTLLAEHAANRCNHGHKLYALLVFMIWHERFCR